MLNTDVVLLGWANRQEIGYYSIGQRVVGILYTLPALLMSGFPDSFRFVQQNEKKEKKILTKNQRLDFFGGFSF